MIVTLTQTNRAAAASCHVTHIKSQNSEVHVVSSFPKKYLALQFCSQRTKNSDGWLKKKFYNFYSGKYDKSCRGGRFMDKTNLLILSLGASLWGCLQECQKVGILSSLKQYSIYYIYVKMSISHLVTGKIIQFGHYYCRYNIRQISN